MAMIITTRKQSESKLQNKTFLIWNWLICLDWSILMAFLSS